MDAHVDKLRKARPYLLELVDTNKDEKISWSEYVAACKKGIYAEDDDQLGFAGRMRKIREIVIYLVFMVFFTLQSVRGLGNGDVYYFAKNLQDQFIGVEMLEEHSPVFNKAFADITTVEEFFHFLYGPVTHTAFSPNTFNGDPNFAFNGGSRKGSTIGYGQVLGAVRISQLRSQAFDCNWRVNEALNRYQNFTCYGDNGWFGFGQFSKSSELVSEFGSFTTPAFGNSTPFSFDGIYGYTGRPRPVGSVDIARNKYMSEFKTKKYNQYPAPAYSVLLPPTLTQAQAREVVSALLAGEYVDLHTRAIFVDANVYNPMLDRVCHCTMVGEITSAGGLMPTFDFQVVRLWERVSAVDDFYSVLTTIVGVFYGYYCWEVYREFRVEGPAVLTSFLSMTQILNIVFFFAAIGCIVEAERNYPEEMNPHSPEYFDLGPSLRFKGWAVALQAINVFLNWFKLISILEYSSVFALVNLTIQRSASKVAGFMFVFFIIFYGFSQTHCMLFQGRLADFRTLGDSCFTLMRSLLGDFDFLSLQDANLYLGPILFIIFVVLAVFVVLNMLIAIISDAYMEVEQELQQKPEVHILQDIKDFIIIQMLHGDLACLMKAFSVCRLSGPVRRWAEGKLDERAGVSRGMIHPEDSTQQSTDVVAKANSPEEGGSGNDGADGGTESLQALAGLVQALTTEVKSMRNEVYSMRAEQTDTRQVMALLSREVQGSLKVVRSVTTAASPKKRASTTGSPPPDDAGGDGPPLPGAAAKVRLV